MKTKLTLFLLLFLIFSLISNAQYTDFDISKYKLPDIKTSSLDLQIDLNHNLQNIKSEGGIDQSYSIRNLGGGINANLYHFRNTLNYQGSQSVVFSYTPYFYKSVNNDLENISNYNLVSVSLNSINRFYNSSSNFIEVLPSLSYSPYISYYSYQDDSEKNKDHSIIFSAPVSIGHGRIEPVQDARLAIYILDELTKQGRIVNPPDEAKILELAGEISKIKRKRFFDSRIKKIEELQAIDSFLVSNNIVSSNDIVYFIRLNDQWDYAYGPVRNSGFLVNFGFNNKVNIDRDWTESVNNGAGPVTTRVKMNQFTLGVFGKLQYSKPLNLCWQTDLTVRLPYDYLITRDPSDIADDVNDYNTHRLKPSLDYSIQYLPNSRTSIGLSLGGYYQYLFGERLIYSDLFGYAINYKVSGKDLNCSANLNMYYYFSPRLRLEAACSLFLDKINNTMKSDLLSNDEITKITNLNDYIAVRLIYSFF